MTNIADLAKVSGDPDVSNLTAEFAMNRFQCDERSREASVETDRGEEMRNTFESCGCLGDISGIMENVRSC